MQEVELTKERLLAQEISVQYPKGRVELFCLFIVYIILVHHKKM